MMHNQDRVQTTEKACSMDWEAQLESMIGGGHLDSETMIDFGISYAAETNDLSFIANASILALFCPHYPWVGNVRTCSGSCIGRGDSIVVSLSCGAWCTEIRSRSETRSMARHESWSGSRTRPWSANSVIFSA